MQKILKRIFMIMIAVIAVIAVAIGEFLTFINVKYRHVDKDIRLMELLCTVQCQLLAEGVPAWKECQGKFSTICLSYT